MIDSLYNAIMLAYLKPLTFLLCLVPLARLVFFGMTEQLGANPVEFITRSTGTWTLVLLCITLSVTPLRKWTGWHKIAMLRRMLGLFTFFYACLHFTTYIWLDQWFDVASMIHDIAKRPFITVGFAAFVLLIPLAVTSNNAIIKKLGGKRWQRLHRLVYLVATLAILHFWWHKAGKHDFGQPIIYGSIVLMLLLVRLKFNQPVRTGKQTPCH